jgi:hypothetical protein
MFLRKGARCHGMICLLLKTPPKRYAADQLRGLPGIAFYAHESSLNLPEVWRKALQRLRLRYPGATRDGLPSQEGRTQSMDADERDSVL